VQGVSEGYSQETIISYFPDIASKIPFKRPWRNYFHKSFFAGLILKVFPIFSERLKTFSKIHIISLEIRQLSRVARQI
jgi:hypothetical protein